MTGKQLKQLDKFIMKNTYNDELKDIYLREILDQYKIYE